MGCRKHTWNGPIPKSSPTNMGHARNPRVSFFNQNQKSLRSFFSLSRITHTSRDPSSPRRHSLPRQLPPPTPTVALSASVSHHHREPRGYRDAYTSSSVGHVRQLLPPPRLRLFSCRHCHTIIHGGSELKATAVAAVTRQLRSSPPATTKVVALFETQTRLWLHERVYMCMVLGFYLNGFWFAGINDG